MQKKCFILFLSIIFLSCRKDIIIENTPENVFLTFWKIMDENYVYFQEKNLDWDSIFNVYYPQAKAVTNEKELHGIFSEIIPLFKDGHVGISCHLPGEFYSDISYHFRDDDESIQYRDNPFDTIPSMEKLGFVEHKKNTYYQYKHKNYSLITVFFSEPMTDLISYLNYLDYRDGLILDLTRSTGGKSNNVYDITSLFFTGEKIVGYKQNKTGKGHNDFTGKIPVFLEGKNIIPENVPVVVLTGPYTFSAGNIFSYIMKELPNCIIIGKKTGGGGGARCEALLPNGWVLSYPFYKYFNAQQENTEFSLMPDIYVTKKNEDNENITHITDVIARAIEVLDSINGF